MSDVLERLLKALCNAPLSAGADVGLLADALWLAASGAVAEGTPPTPTGRPDETAPDPESDRPDRTGEDTPQEAAATPGRGTQSKEWSTRSPGAATKVRGLPLSLGRANPLPDALAVGRAIQPFRQPWRHGARSRLDVEATVEHYARGGPLVPLFRPAPEPWFEMVLLVDSSLSMGIYEETTRAVSQLLTTVGGFRAVRTWHLEWRGAEPRVCDQHGREVPGDRVPHHGSGTQGRRLVLLVSDCAARGWRTPVPWLLLRAWGDQIPVALLDPLPPRLWRRSALNLPVVRVTAGQAGGHNGALRHTLPPRLRPRPGEEDTAGPWAALPVVSCTPRSLAAWAGTLMRADPRGCDAVLIPAVGRLPAARGGTAPVRRLDLARLAEAFVHTAPGPAVRLAVMCSGLPDLPLPLLHALRDQAVPEAEYSDLAEVLTSGLFTVRRDTDGNPLLVLQAQAREYLGAYLTTHDRWLTRAALGRHAAAHPYAPQGIAAVLHDALSATELPATERPLAEMGTTSLPRPEPEQQRPEERRRARAARPDEDATDPLTRGGEPSGPADEAYVFHAAVLRDMWPSHEPSTGSRSLHDTETLLRHLIGYVESRLPAPLGGWPGPDTCLDDLRAARGALVAADVVDDLCGYFSRRGVTLEKQTSADGTSGHDLLWWAPGGPLRVTVGMRTESPWSHTVQTVRHGTLRETAATSPVEFLVVIDESDKPKGLLPLARCVTFVERDSPRGAVVLLNLQSRYGKAPRNSRAALLDRLTALHRRAGSPEYQDLAREYAQTSSRALLEADTLRDWFRGRALPADERGFDRLTRFLVRRAGLEDDVDWSPYRFAALLHHARAEENRGGEDTPALFLGRPVAELRESTEVHGETRHDSLLRNAVRHFTTGESSLVLLIGPPWSGTASSLPAALRLLPDGYRVWEPHTPDELAAALGTPGAIGPRTVIWLSDVDRYFLDDTDGDRGESVAAGLRERLQDAEGDPVLLLGSLSAELWAVLSSDPPPGSVDPHPQARALCQEWCLPIHMSRWPNETRMERYAAAPPASRALVGAAIDVLRCGHGPDLPLALLTTAAPGYLSDREVRRLDQDWIESALTYVTDDTPPGTALLSPVRSPGRAAEAPPAYYRLADDLERHGRDARRGCDPPESLWSALAEHASVRDLAAIARTARGQGQTERAEHFDCLAGSGAERGGATPAPALRKLLQRTDFPPERADAVVEQALDWLRAHDRPESAQYVLNGLLSRAGLSPRQAAQAVAYAFDWLRAYDDTPAAEYVLGPLLNLPDLPEHQAQEAATIVLRWLDHHGERQSAQFVLRPALLRGDLSEEQTRTVTEQALRWQHLHGSTLGSQFVLSAALRRHDLGPADRAAFVRHAIDWLEGVGIDASAKFVLRPLLQRTDLASDESVAAVRLAQRWLRAHSAARDAQFVLNALLFRSDLASADVAEAAEHAHAWLNVHGTHSEARFVLRPLLARSDLPPALVNRAVEMGAHYSRVRREKGEPDDGVQELVNARARAAARETAHGWLILLVDIADFGGRADTGQAEARLALSQVLSRVLPDDTALPWETWDSGDGVVVLLPGRVRHSDFVADLLTSLEEVLGDRETYGRLRLRAALHVGDLMPGELGWRGQALVVASRLLDSSVLRSALRAGSRSQAAVVVSDELFGTAFHSPAGAVSPFRQVFIRSKGGVENAWITVLGYPEPPGIDQWTRPPSANR
ncbi:SAV_2336 N-terminal domain-related protein [Streptomyces sp. NPDC059781]|uniref:SAV_2336 N-terminal domain-related protein n=1 Tax=Streptomyces sp. NPDC059781 TaxID=3346943 RepID=UPI00364A496A